MDATNLLIDTSVFIEHFRKQNKQTSIFYGLVGQYKSVMHRKRVPLDLIANRLYEFISE